MLYAIIRAKNMNGVILLNKPAGMTSFDAVSKCRRILKEKKAGHTGTLDPNASGLMIVLMGRYTKLAPFCVSDRKTYDAVFSFGMCTDTQDIWGSVTEERTPGVHSDEELRAAAVRLTGTYEQMPPMYSAIKVNGRKLYEYARKGIEIERKARLITVHELAVSRIAENSFAMHACVSSGTYIRTLIQDYCGELGELGTMTALVRSGIDHLTVADAISLEDLNENSTGIDPAAVVDPAWKLLPASDPIAVRNGRALLLEETAPKVILTSEGQLLAAYEKGQDGLYHCVRGLF